jgi:hypothetical protein
MRQFFDSIFVIFLGGEVSWCAVKTEKSSMCFQFETSQLSVFNNVQQDGASKEVFVEALLCREHHDRTNACPGKINSKHAFPGTYCAPNSSSPSNIGPDPHRCPEIVKINPCLIPRIDIRPTSVCSAFQECEELARSFDPSGFLRAVERMQQPFEIHLPHVQITAQDGFHSFVVNTEDLCTLFLGQVSLAFDQRTDSVNVCTFTGPLGPRQISKVGAPALEGCGPLLDGPQGDHIRAIDLLKFGLNRRVGCVLKPQEVYHGPQLHRDFRML